MLNLPKFQIISTQALMTKKPLENVIEGLFNIIQQRGKQSAAKPKPVEFRRGLAATPATGTGFPFYPTSFGSGVKPFGSFSLKI